MTHSKSESEIIVAVGAQWGNEGKGKLVANLCRDADVCARFNGGANNIHTISMGCDGSLHPGRRVGGQKEDSPIAKEVVLRLFPLGVINKNCKVVFGNGMVVHLPTLMSEIRSIENSFDPAIRSRLYISTRAHVVFDFHQVMDEYFDDIRKNHLGTSGKGIGPAYSTKTTRNGLRIGDLFSDRSAVKDQVTELITYFTKYDENLSTEIDRVVDETLSMFSEIKHCVTDTVGLMKGFLDEGKRIVCESADSVMSDIDFGTYPYVTSSNTTAGAASVGLGFPPTKISKVIGLCKSFTTRAKHWFPSEISDPTISGHLIERGHELGTTSGRPRRVGWLDLVQVKYASEISGFDTLMLTKLDALAGLDRVGIVTAYEGVDVERDGYPSTEEGFFRIKPVVEYLPGWEKSDISSSVKAGAFVDKIAQFLKLPVVLLD